MIPVITSKTQEILLPGQMLVFPERSNICFGFFNLNYFIKKWNAVDPLQSLHSVKHHHINGDVRYIH